MNSSHPEPSPKERFEFLYSSLCKHYSQILDIALKVTGFLLLVMGWLVTSQTAQESLNIFPSLRGVGIAAVLFTGLSFSLISVRLYKKSQKIAAQLQDLDYFPRDYYSDQVIERRNLTLFLLSDIVMTVVTCSVFLII